jgi:hypothetical protein
MLCESACTNGELPLRDLLATILERADCEPPLFYAEEVDRWPLGYRKEWLECGCLREITPTLSLPCPSCGGEDVEEVVFLDGAHGQRAYLPCSECGPVEINMDRLRRWEVDIESLLLMIYDGFDCRGPITELSGNRFWGLGSTCLCGRRRDVFFGRMLHDDDGWEVLSRWRVPASGIVFVPSQMPSSNSTEKSPTIVSLTTAALWRGGSLSIDRTYIESEFAGREAPALPKGRLPKRARRTAMIDALTNELIEHLRAAYEYACVTAERTGEPQLLPRPTQRQLARRIGASLAGVNRCLADDSARELRFLWEMAGYVEQVRCHGRQTIGAC